MQYKITVVETLEKTYLIQAGSHAKALDRLIEEPEDAETIKQLDWHVEEVKEFCECGGIIYDNGYCIQCLEDMDERDSEMKRIERLERMAEGER